MTTPRDIANAQLVAYNARDLAAFMALLAEDAWIEDVPTGHRLATGKAAITEIYRARFGDSPNLHCVVHTTMDEGNFAIDHETVTGLSDGSEINAIAIIRSPRCADPQRALHKAIHMSITYPYLQQNQTFIGGAH